MVKFFNTAGPNREEMHYFIPLSQRIDVAEILMLIDQKKYLVLHAPRQSGKTTALLELCKILNHSGQYKCLYTNVESAQTARGHVEQAMRIISQDLARREKIYLPEDDILASNVDEIYRSSPASALGLILTKWAQESHLPTILLIDEIDSLVGDTLISVLRQIRDGYPERPKNFPQSVILCGVRDVRDYRMDDGSGKALVTGGSAYNINPP